MSAKDNVIRLWKNKRPDIQSIAELERKINLSNGLIQKWDSKTPSTKSAQKVADFFKVPLSDILNDVSDDSVKLDVDDQKVLTLFRKATEGMPEDEVKDFTNSMGILMNTARELIRKRRQ
ncbi:hypothetical protein SAMN04487792_1522 [Lactobacillus bombicola]|uniref:HTH cro/C1-type domain-containing protein n=1 Tax=Lactobacillus bombicola TaxID=1505723 RepID=A0A1I1TNP6_9LACO|nr:helix-turn-helix transcriptional regulator [Lactobacillus bombicola]SFD60139.1 hypothetical protein SAMN04487792_1522 [Lactobacillus bombicola]